MVQVGTSAAKLNPGTLLAQAADLSLFPQQTISVINNISRGASWDSIQDLGASPEEIQKTECYLLLVVLDDSGSMRGSERDVMEAYNAFLDDYKTAKKSEEISSDVLIAVAGLFEGIIYPYTRIEDAKPLSEFYAPGGSTPLYDVTIKAEGLQIAKTTELSLYGISVKTVTLLITDGRDNASYARVSDVENVLQSIQEDRNHIVGGIYRGDADQYTFSGMGVPPKWILDGGRGGKDLLNAFSRFSRASRSALSKGDAGVIS